MTSDWSVSDGMLYRNSIEYQPFSDEQVALFSEAAKLTYLGDPWWRDELDEAAQEYIIDHYRQQWDSPSHLIKALKRIKRNPSTLLCLIADEINALPMPLSASLCHGTGWTHDQLANAAGFESDFVAGVTKEIEFLLRIIEKRKAIGATGNQGKIAARHLINRVAFAFQDAFLQGANVGLSVPIDGSPPTGPFVRFSKAVLKAMQENLSNVVRVTDRGLEREIQGMHLKDSTSVFQHFWRSEYYKLITGNGKMD